PLPAIPGFTRFVRHEPVGVVLDISAWNYPLLITVNVVVPAVLAGNAVVLKHANRTALCGDAFARAFERAGAPENLVTAIDASHETCAQIIARPEIGYVSFTGSVRGGHEVYRVGHQAGIEEASPPCRVVDRLSAAENAAAFAARFLDLRSQLARRVGLRHRAHRGGAVQRIAEAVLPHLRQRTLDEALVERGVHVDALDPAAALPGVVVGAVDEIGDGMVEVGVGGDVGRILAAQLEPDVDEAPGALAIDLMSAAHGAREADVSDLRPGDDLRAGLVAGVD